MRSFAPGKRTRLPSMLIRDSAADCVVAGEVVVVAPPFPVVVAVFVVGPETTSAGATPSSARSQPISAATDNIRPDQRGVIHLSRPLAGDRCGGDGLAGAR